MIRILAVETATRACSVALLQDDECHETLRLEQNRHAELLIPMARELLAEAGCRFDQLDALAFGSGPGSFTGLRIGISVVQGLAYGLGCPLLPVSSLRALAARVDAPRVLAAFDARMGQVYWNVYERDRMQIMKTLGEPRVGDPESVRLPDAGSWIAAGSGCDVYRDRIPRDLGMTVTFAAGVHPHAEDAARIARTDFEAGGAIDPRLAAPEYVRNEIVQRRER